MSRVASPLRRAVAYVRANPFSTMALCNIIGDSCYLGYAFTTERGLSPPQFAGAFAAMVGHLILLAYGDAEMKVIHAEKGFTARAMDRLRALAIRGLKPVLGVRRIAKPYFWAFGLMVLNGLGLLAESFAMRGSGALSQTLLGVTIVIGCACFAAADLVRRQKTADILTKVAPSFFVVATAGNVFLSAATWNPFILVGTLVFVFSNAAGYLTRIDKGEGAQRHGP